MKSESQFTSILFLGFVLVGGVIVFMLVMIQTLAPVSELVIPVAKLPITYQGTLAHANGTVCVRFHTKHGEPEGQDLSPFLDRVKFRVQLSCPGREPLIFWADPEGANVGGLMVFARSDGKKDPGLRFGVPGGKYELQMTCDGVEDVTAIEFYRER